MTGKAPYREIALMKPSVEAERRADGSILLRSTVPLGAYDTQSGEWLRRWAAERPDLAFLAERDATGGFRKLTYRDARGVVDAISQALLDRGLGPDRPVMILSGNSIDHGLIMLGAMQVGIPAAPASPSYSLLSEDFAKIILIRDQVKPAMVFAEDGAMFEKVLRGVDFGGAEIVVSKNPPDGLATTPFSALCAATPGPEVETAFAAVTPDMVAKYLCTSGSTGIPKAVINTHRMICANRQMHRQLFPFQSEVPPVLVDWLPWHHTFGGNHCFNHVLYLGGTFFIDDGRPAPGLIEKTVATLREISPTAFYNVPAGFAMLLPFLERDAGLRDKFFKEMRFLVYGGAALSSDLWERLEDVAVKATGKRIVIAAGFGSTESAPMVTHTHWPIERAGNIGLPPPGIEIKLAPVGPKYEIRARGPSISPGYLGRPDLTEGAFDEEGFFRFGDAVKLADPDDPSQGLLFDGRLTEEFKLASGTWVHTGVLRTDVIAAAAPAIQDAVICGQDREYVAILAWPNLEGCRAITGSKDASVAELIDDASIRRHIAERLAAFNRDAGGGSRRVRRVHLMTEPAQIDANEITDKGYVNQRATLDRRAALVEKLYADPPGAEIIVVG